MMFLDTDAPAEAAPRREHLVRVFRTAAVLSALAATVVWLRPVNVPGSNLQPFGCGTPASPATGELEALVCTASVGAMRGVAAGLLVTALALLLVGEITPRIARIPTGWLWALLPALPMLILSVTVLFTPLVAHGADGAKFVCGSAAAPAADPIVSGQCGELAAARRVTATGGIAAALLVLAGTAYVLRAPAAARDSDSEAEGQDEDTRDPHTGDPDTRHPGTRDPEAGHSEAGESDKGAPETGGRAGVSAAGTDWERP